MGEITVTVRADGEQQQITGPAARMILRLVTLADKINVVMKGKVILNYAGDGSVTAMQEIYHD